jgi:D-alanine--poly(phosphoribitol) ligase subunit 1
MFRSEMHKSTSLAQVVKLAALKFPDNKALHINEKYYNYSELFKIVDAVYKKIPREKVYDRIGIFCNDDVFTYASILAVNLYGAAYVPLNRKYPSQRNKRIIEESGIQLILTSSSEHNLFSNHLEIIFTSDENRSDDSSELIQRSFQNISYILFTSGSTGEPKGVPVTHSNVKAFFEHFFKNYDFNSKDKFLQTYELTFDVSVFSFFMPLMVGACCYILPDQGSKPVKIAECLQKHEITVVSMVPGVIQYLEKYLPEIKLPSLRFSFFSGDALYYHQAVKWQQCLPNGKIHNFYGPTETTIVCTGYVFDEFKSEKESVNDIVPLGKAFDGMQFIIVDEDLKESSKGELCFSGDQVIPAYLNNSNEDKFFSYKNKRFYCTGDIASLNSNGNLIFHGRTDSQVKINGYRVELPEIENAINKMFGIKTIVLCVKEKEINQLVAYIETASFKEEIIKRKLSELLPDYMIPFKFISTLSFPLNENGKIDRQALINAYI